jgi:hypothetical protein
MTSAINHPKLLNPNGRRVYTSDPFSLMSYLVSVALLIFLIIQSYIYIAAPGRTYTIVSQLFGISVFFCFLASGKVPRMYFYIVVSFIFALLLSSLIIGRQNPGMGNVANVLSAAGIAILLLRANIVKGLVVLWFFGVAGYYSSLIVSGESVFHQNAISVHMLFVTLTLYIIYLRKDSYIPVYPTVILLVICICVVGRGGIVTSVFLLVGILAVNLKRMIKYPPRRTLLAIFVIFILSAFFILSAPKNQYFQPVNVYRVLYDFKSRQDVTGARPAIIEQYFRDSSFAEILFGQEVKSGSIGEDWGGNTHNSFLGLMQFTGIFGLFIFLTVLFINIRLVFIKAVAGILLATLVLRMSIEHIVWFAPYDFLIFVFIYYYISHKILKRHLLLANKQRAFRAKMQTSVLS